MTIARAVRGVRNRIPSVPSRRSRLRQSAVNNGTSSQMVTNSAVFRLPNSFAPSPGALSRASIIITAKMISDTDAPSARNQ